MKRLCILLLILASCASSRKTITRPQIDSEQARIDSYYIGHVSFRPSFYDASDSVFASLKGDDASIFAGLYKEIRAERSGDSTNLHFASPNYYTHLAEQFDAIISAGKAGY